MPLCTQLATLQIKNSLVTSRFCVTCLLQHICLVILVFFGTIAFYFVEGPLESIEAATWELSTSTRALSPRTLHEIRPLPRACFTHTGESLGALHEDESDYEGETSTTSPIVNPAGDFLRNDIRANSYHAYKTLGFDQVVTVLKVPMLNPGQPPVRKTLGMVGGSHAQALADRIVRVAGMKFQLAEHAYNLLNTCPPFTPDCEDLWRCFAHRLQIQLLRDVSAGHEEDCWWRCGSTNSTISSDPRWSAVWPSVKDAATTLMVQGLTNPRVDRWQIPQPGCTDTTTGFTGADQVNSSVAEVQASEWLADIDAAVGCESSRRLATTPGRPAAAASVLRRAEAAAAGTSRAAPAAAAGEKRRRPRGHRAAGLVVAQALAGPWPAVRDLLRPGRIDRLRPLALGKVARSGRATAVPAPAHAALPELEAPGRNASAGRAGSAMGFLAAGPEAMEAAAPGRRLVDCYSISDACECAEHRGICGWRQLEQECAEVGENANYAPTTTCWECSSQPDCVPADTWASAPAAIQSLMPVVRVFGSSEELDEHMKKEGYGRVSETNGLYATDSICAAVVLESTACLDGAGGDCSYTIRLNGTDLQAFAGTGYFEALRGTGWSEGEEWGSGFTRGMQAYEQYFETTGFMHLQHYVDDYLLRPSSPASDADAIAPSWYFFLPFPRTSGTQWNADLLSAFIGEGSTVGENNDYGMAGFSAFGLIIFSYSIVSRALREKEDQLRDGMRMMGLSDTAYYLSIYMWAVTYFLIPSTIMTIIWQMCPTVPVGGGDPKMFDLFGKTDFIWVWLLCFLALLANTSFGLMWVPVVGRARTGRILAPASMYFLSYINFAGPTSLSAKTATGLVPAVAYLNGIGTWAKLEDLAIGLSASTLDVEIAQYSFGTSLWILVVDIFLYFVIFWYLDQVAPYGTGHRPPWFLFTRGYWAESFSCCERRQEAEVVAVGEQDGEAFEQPTAAQLEMTQENKTLEVAGLRKTFKAQGRTIAAVDGVSFSIYPGEIYVLLGHNGAGKTTSISCLTGLIRPTAGKAALFGKPLWTFLQTTEGRKQVGICPQHNVLWKELTCMEHATLFGAFRGLSRSVARASSVDILAQCGLSAKGNAQSKALSGGMKRKLCLALALVGEPKLCFLDEPTSGMDPTARRDTWDLLRRQKEGRILVLTTHYMDEADVLGDRIGIMAKGQMQCLGSPVFLKKHYGCGYNINFELEGSSTKKQTRELVAKELAGYSDVRIMSEAGSELVLLVDFAASKAFPALFAKLDDEGTKKELGLRGWSIAVCHLEEVFIRVAAAEKTAAIGASKSSDNIVVAPGAADGDVTAELRPNVCRQVGVMLAKRARYTVRDPLLLFCQLLCPCIAFAVILGIMQGFATDEDRLELSLDLHNDAAFDAGHPRTVIPWAAVESNENMSAVGQSTVSMGLADEAPGIYFMPDATCTPDQNPSDVLWSEECTDDTCWATTCKAVNGIQDRSLASYARALGCGLLGTAGDQAASRYAAALPVSVDASGASTIVLGVNLSSIHIAPIGLNLGSNLLRREVGAPGTVKVASHPFPLSDRQRSEFFGGDGLLLSLALVLPAFIFPFPTAFSAAYVIREKETGIKAQHMMSGVGITTYWLTNILADILIFCVAIAIVLLMALAFGADAVTYGDTVLVIFIFSLAQVPFGYLIGSLFSTAAAAQNFVLAFNMGVCFVFGTAGFILRLTNLCMDPLGLPSRPDECTISFSDWLDPIFRFVPGYALGEALQLIGLVNIQLKVTPVSARSAEWYAECEDAVKYSERPYWACVDDPLHYGAAGGPLVHIAVVAIAYTLIITLIDFLQLHPALRRLLHFEAKAIPKPEGWEDETVLAEAGSLPPASEAAVHVADVRKVYGPVGLNRCIHGGGALHAVKGVNFAMSYGEVFGLLGTNGAGKSTIFNMIAGHFSPTEGAITVAGLDMNTGAGSSTARTRIGYCPQDNALLEMMTTREHLYFYCNLKGVPAAVIPEVVEAKLDQLGLASFASNYAANLSGGNKRKLMVACALIGDPPIVLADEPSAGMDPVARRFMWGVIQNVATKQKRSSVLLSTHSMEECEALCARSSIMVNGVFRTIGSNREIRTRYGGAFELMCKVRRPTEAQMEALTSEWGQPEDARLGKQWAAEAMKTNGFVVAALDGPSSPFVDAYTAVAPKVFAEWCIYTARFQKLHAFVPGLCDRVELVEWHGPMAQYKIWSQSSLGELFTRMEDSKDSLEITEYSLSATTLEQIFNSFARQQEGQDKLESREQAPAHAAQDLGRFLMIARDPSQASTADLVAAMTKPLDGQDVSWFVVDNSELNAATPGLGYRTAKDVGAQVNPQVFIGAAWGSTVKGVQTGDGWLQVGQWFLPLEVQGVPVVVPKPGGQDNDVVSLPGQP